MRLRTRYAAIRTSRSMQLSLILAVSSLGSTTDVLRTQPRPVNAWAAKDTCLISIEKRPFFIGICMPSGYWQIRVRGCRKTVGRWIGRPQTLLCSAKCTPVHSKFAGKHLHLPPLFRKKVGERYVNHTSEDAGRRCGTDEMKMRDGRNNPQMDDPAQN